MGLGIKWVEDYTHEHRNTFLELLPRFWDGSVQGLGLEAEASGASQ